MINPTIRVVLVDDHRIVLDGLHFLLSAIENVEVAAALTDSREVVPWLEANNADIVVTDLHMPHLSGIDILLKTRPLFPELKVLLLTMAEDAANIREAVRAGVHGYLLKKTNKNELEKAIITLMTGKNYYSDGVIEELAQSPAEDLNECRPATIQSLTRRELEILKLISEENSTTEIAEKLYISIPTVETHRRNLMIKLNARNLAGLVKYAVRHGLV